MLGENDRIIGRILAVHTEAEEVERDKGDG